jgi:hypothetical protein
VPITEIPSIFGGLAVSDLWATDEPSSGEVMRRPDLMVTPRLVILAVPSLVSTMTRIPKALRS